MELSKKRLVRVSGIDVRINLETSTGIISNRAVEAETHLGKE